MRQQFSAVSEVNINTKIGAFLAQSPDRDGGRKERALVKRQITDAAAIEDAGVVTASDQES